VAGQRVKYGRLPTGVVPLRIRGKKGMSEQSDELRKLVAVATDFVLSVELRVKAIELVGDMGTHEALLALLGMAGNDQLTREERELALKHAGKIIKSEK
jgi:hypothetical protein